jgi:glycerate 2-kinase
VKIRKKSTIKPGCFKNDVIDRNGRMGADACRIMASAIEAVDPYWCVQEQIKFTNNKIEIHNQIIELDCFERIFLIGFGKASVPMAKALMDILGDIIIQAMVITKDEKFTLEDGYRDKLKVFLGGHPVPTQASIDSTQALMSSLPKLTKRDLILVVISGGGSALFTDPIQGISLKDMQSITEDLLMSGGDIYEINTIRKHLDQVKGGRLALRLQPAEVHTIILSDVIGDRLDVIASGPTVPDPTSYRDGLNIIKKYQLEHKTPRSILDIFEKGIQGIYDETLKPGGELNSRVQNHIVGTIVKAALAAKDQAEDLDYHSLIISSYITGQTKDLAEFLEGIILTEQNYGIPVRIPACLILGGETTVEVKGDGIGGRNQDLVMQMVRRLDGRNGVLFISLATDGEDGPTDAAGAVADALVFSEGVDLYNMHVDAYIENFDSYSYFNKLGGLIKIGATGTNVNDLIIILVNHSEM